jgi:hypothetical protein
MASLALELEARTPDREARADAKPSAPAKSPRKSVTPFPLEGPRL